MPEVILSIAILVLFSTLAFIIGDGVADERIRKDLLKGEYKFKFRDRQYISRTKEIVPKEVMEIDPVMEKG